jgi:hypothetical protein
VETLDDDEEGGVGKDWAAAAWGSFAAEMEPDIAVAVDVAAAEDAAVAPASVAVPTSAAAAPESALSSTSAERWSLRQCTNGCWVG